MMSNEDVINLEGLDERIVDGAYIRTLTINAGVIVKSEIWKKQRLWIVSQGDFTYSTSNIKTRIKAPWMGLAPYGEPVIVHAHEKTIIHAITGTEKQELGNIKQEQIICHG